MKIACIVRNDNIGEIEKDDEHTHFYLNLVGQGMAYCSSQNDWDYGAQ